MVVEPLEPDGDRSRPTCSPHHDRALHDAVGRVARAHASQVEPDSRFFFWPHELLLGTWATDDYELVRSRSTHELPEDDLFAGVEED